MRYIPYSMPFSIPPASKSVTRPNTLRDPAVKRFVRPSEGGDDGHARVSGQLGLQITPVYHGQLPVDPYHDRLPGLSFSGQLLELGLKHNVDGLIKKAQEQLEYRGSPYRPPAAIQHYERAQEGFAELPHAMIARTY